ncbi:hypothetical protein ATO6_19935 [Oceanicola sp. 22II-s10i]|uniref:TRAP transporter substrate-binding protein n=1 Tax=Oceanicola sp. 22II-s10i TaxID=1317116 RepID=UPI000B522C6C|nr:TRAP transporter substrate-binding protein [Oceanicola sp. 22II-s10i]OWU83129.1 hypothetical protein ATO6_19935 [Oceanicola sp. 22II-s10i]
MTYSRILTAGAIFATTAVSAAAQDVTLRYSSWLPLQHYINTDIVFPYFEQIEEVTEGRVVVEALPKTVGTAAGQFDVVRDGLADISFIVTGYTPGRFVMSEIGEMSWVGNDPAVFAPIFWDIFEESIEPLGEYDGVKVMTLFANAPGHILTTEKKIETMEDLQGLKLRTAGPYATSMLEAVGAVPILKSANEAFELMSTGVIDGSLSQPDTVISLNWLDLASNYTIVPGGLFSATLGVIMNEDSWSRISAEDQEAIWAISGRALAEKAGGAFSKAVGEAIEQMNATEGMTVDTVSDDMLAQLQEATVPLEEAWAERAREKGMENPLEVLAEFRRRVAEAESQATN